MADVADVTTDTQVTTELGAAAPAGERPPVQPGATPTPPSGQKVWSMPKSPVTRTQADKFGRIALETAKSTGKFIAGIARFGAGMVTQTWRAIEAVPRAVLLFIVAGLLMLVGLVGAIALDNSLGLICTVVVIPVCSVVLGALGHRWYSGLGNQRGQHTDAPAVQPVASDLQRSVEYVDKKLAVALTAFGTERHQQAVIALFQAKTAVELTLGTEQDTAGFVDVPLRTEDQNLRPRIRVGSASKSLLRESNSLAAS